jgi:N-acetyl-anhydromuramyl-L-alanine amidase AmpD
MLSIPNNNFFYNRSGYIPRYVVVHGTAGGTSAEAIARYFQTVFISSHYVIGTDGEVVQCVLESDGAWANGGITTGHDPWWTPEINPNNLTIAIEHCKPAQDNSSVLTDAQKQSSFQLIKDICDRWNIPKQWADESGGITGHFSIDPVNRSHCPGPFPFDELFTFLNGETMIPAGWHDDGTTLTAPNGHKVVRGFRQYILKQAWDPNNYPLEEERHADPVEKYYPSDEGTLQTFNYSRLCWTPKRGVYVMGVGNEILGCERDLNQTNIPLILSDIKQLAKDAQIL